MTTETGTENFQVASGNFSTPSNEISNIEKEDFVPEVPKKPFSAYITVCILCLFVAFGGFIFGWDTGTISGFINQSDYKGRFADKVDKDGLPSFSNTRTGLIVSFFNIGCAVGGIILSKLGDVYGRKKGLTIVTLIYCIGIVVQITTTTKWYQYFIGRIIAGLGVGATAVLSPMLISETSPKHLRGALVSCYQLMITAGIFLGNCSNYGVKDKYTDAKQWRLPLGLGFVWAALMILGMSFVPESPRYLVEVGRTEDAKRSLARSNKVPMDDPSIQAELDAIQAGVESEKMAGSASWGELFSTKTKVFQRVIMGILVQSLQQLTGINYFFYYGVSIFKSVGLDDSFQTAIILSCVNLISTFFCIYIVGRFGRRTCLLWASFAMSFLMLAFATIGTVKLKSDDPAKNSKSAGNGMIVVTCLYIFCFATTWAPLAFVIVSETFPLRIKSKGMAVATAANWVWNFLIGFFTPFITSAIRFSYGYVFMGSLMFAFVYIFFSVPETKGLTLEEVEEMWQEGVLPWKSGSWVPASRRDATYDAAALTHDDKPWYKQMF